MSVNFFKAVAAFAAVATLVQLGVLTLVGAHFLTLDGNTLRIVAFVVAFVLAVIVPAALSFGAIRSLEARERKPRRGALVAGVFALLNGVGATAILWGVDAPVSVLASGGSNLLWTEASATDTEDAQPDATTGEQTPAKPDTTRPPKGSDAVESSRKALQTVLIGDDARELPAALTDESAAALGTLWMAFLTEQFPDLHETAGPELWSAVHTGLPDQLDLWSDPAALETLLVPRGREFLSNVLQVADAAVDGHGTGPVTWPVLPTEVVDQLLTQGSDTAWKNSAPWKS